MAEEHRIIYVCQECFTMAGEARTCCEHKMIRLDAGIPGDERSKPLMDERGNLKTRAPLWWVERNAWWTSENQ